MKVLQILILIAIFILSFSACSKEGNDVVMNNNIECQLDFQDHSNATSFQGLIDNFTNDGFVGMTLLVDHPTDGLWIGSSGMASIEESIDMNPCHLHHTASLYKTFIAVIMMQLADENMLNLNDKLTDHLPASITDRLPNGDDISIKNLLQQRTGLPDIFEVEFITDFFNNPKKQFTIEELLEYIYEKDPLSEVDTEFYYSDANFSILTLIIENIEGDFIEAIKSRIFEPLALSDTYFLVDENQLPAGLADSYWDRYGDGDIENNTDVQVALTIGLKGSDGVVSSAEDLKTIMQALASGALVTDVSLMTEFLDVPEEVQKQQVYSGYGMGLMKVKISGEEWYGHFGNQIGSGAILLYNTDKDVTMVALQNTGTFFSDEIKGKFFYQLLDEIESIVF